MKIYKRFLSVFFVALLSFVLISCGNTTTNSTTALTTDNTTNTTVNTDTTVKSTETTTKTTTKQPDTSDVTTKEEIFLLLNRASVTLNVGENSTLVAEMTDGSTPIYVWTSSNPDVATVENGVVTAISAGETTITVSFENYSAEAIVTVNNVVDLIFSELDPIAFVGDELELDVLAKVNGIDVYEDVTLSGEGFSIDGSTLTLNTSGVLEITASYPGVASITRTITVYHEVKTVEDFEAINNDLDGYYMMTADIDLEGGTLNTVAHYTDGHSSASTGFNGVFDGNGHSISSFHAVYNNATSDNSSPFGTIGVDGVVKNTNFLGVSIISRIAGGIATINYGLIDNCFAQVYVEYDTITDVNNPIGGLVSKNYGHISNSIAVVDLKAGIADVNIGGVAGRTLSKSTIENSYSISTSVGRFESAVPTNGEMAGDFTNFEGYATVSSFYDSAVIDSFSSLWSFDEGYFPHLGQVSDTLTITNTTNQLYAGNSLQIEVESKYPVFYALKEAVTGISINENGLLSVEENVGSAQVTVLVTSKFNSNDSDELVINVMENKYTVNSTSDSLSFEWIEGVSETSKYEALHGIEVLYNDQPYTGEYTLVSTNEAVAIVDGDKIVAVGDGTAQINVVLNDSVLYSIEVNSMKWSPITTTDEFLAIGNDATTMSGKYILMNDLDFGGAAIYAFSSWKSINQSDGVPFSGIFDGNNHTIANFEPHQNQKVSTDRDRSLFGYMSSTAVVKNVNFLGVIGKERVGVVSSWNEGTIENIYIEMLFVSATAKDNRVASNPAGIAVTKNRLGASVSNVITVLTFTDDATTQYTGGVVGYNAGSVTNVYTITNRSEVNAIFNSEDNAAVTNAGAYASLEDFYTDANLEGFTDAWTLETGYYPYLGLLEDSISITNITNQLYAGKTLQIEADSTYPVFYALKDAVSGVSIDNNGLLSVEDTVTGSTQITVVVTSKYSADYSDEITITVLENNYKVTSNADSVEFNIMVGESDTSNSEMLHGINILYNDQAYAGEYTITTSNDEVAIVSGDKIIAVGDGSAQISVVINDTVVYTIDVLVNEWVPITTTEEFLAIGNDLESLSKKYKLMNDLDFENAPIYAFSSYKTKNGASGLAFSGVFDGQNFTIANFEPHQNQLDPIDRDRAVFGYLTSTAVVKNVNFIGVIGKDRTAVVSNWNEGTIDNIFVEMYYNWMQEKDDRSANNPSGLIASKNRSSGTVTNSITVLIFAEGANTNYVGGVVGKNDGHVENVYTITNSALTEVVDSGNAAMNGAAYENVLDLQTNADISMFNPYWNFEVGYYPHLGTIIDDLTIKNTSNSVYQDQTMQILVDNKNSVEYALETEVEGVTISDTGLLSIGLDVPLNTEVTVIVTSKFSASLTQQFTFTVSEFTLDVTSEQDAFNFDLVDGVSNENEYEVPHGIVVTHNGLPYEGDVSFISTDSTVAIVVDNMIKAVGDGSTTIDVIVDEVVLKTLTVNVAIWNPVRTTADFLAIGDDEASLTAKYILLNDIDFAGGSLETIGHYSDGNNKTTTGFRGIFDGNNHTISNFYAVYHGNIGSNCSPFGTVGTTGIIRNVNFIGVTVASRIAGGVATINYGTIENVFVEVHFMYNTTSDVNNPMGGIASKNYGTIRNSVTVVSLEDGINSVNIGGIVGRTYGESSFSEASVTENNMTIGPVGIYESATPSGGMLGVATNNEAFTNLEGFYNSADLETFNEHWNFVEGYYPYLGTFADDVTIKNTSNQAYQGQDVQLLLDNKFDVVFSLKTPIDGVLINETGLLTIGEDVALDTEVTVVVTSKYSALVNDEFTFSVSAFTLEIETTQETFNFEWIDGYSELDDYQTPHGVVITHNGSPYTGEVSFESADPSIAMVMNGNVVALNDGSTTIDVIVNGVTLQTLTVHAIKWYPITTTDEFLAIGTNQDTMSKKYKLMNDLDFENSKIYAFSSYKTRNDIVFSGMFDGQNYTISNFEPHQNQADSSDRDRSIFGWLTPIAVVKNTNFIGVIGWDRTSVVSNWNEGTIENIYVEMYDKSTASATNRNANNPAGVIASKNRSTGTVTNCITVLTFREGGMSDYIGGVVGQNSGTVTNVYTITKTGIAAIYDNRNTATNAVAYLDLAVFEANADITMFSDDWNFVNGYKPHLGDNDTLTITNIETEINRGASLAINVNSNYAVVFALDTAIDGVSLSELGELTVSESVPVGTEITVVVTSVYNAELIQEITLTVTEVA